MHGNSAQKPIIIGVDGSQSSIEALRKAAELAAAFGAPLEAIAAWQFPMTYEGAFIDELWSPEGDAKSILSTSIKAAFGAEKPEHLTTLTIAGPTAQVLIKRSKSASMLVLGSRGRGGFAGLLLGSVSTACAQHAHCPVLIMHNLDRHAHGAADEDSSAPVDAAV